MPKPNFIDTNHNSPPLNPNNKPDLLVINYEQETSYIETYDALEDCENCLTKGSYILKDNPYDCVIGLCLDCLKQEHTDIYELPPDQELKVIKKVEG